MEEMQVNIENIAEPIVLCLGNFDGVHRGHQALIKSAINYGNQMGYRKALFTFENHPTDIIKNKNIRFLQTYRQKAKVIKSLGIDYLIYSIFDKEVMNLSPEDFIEGLMKRYNIKAFFVGFDYRFGYKAQGNISKLKVFAEKYKAEVFVLDSVDYIDTKISSTWIRDCICSGKITMAEDLLGRPYAIEGKVIEGIQLGRKIGFPTANIDIHTSYIIPKSGVYFTRVNLDDQSYYAVTNVGNNPTIINKPFSIESHIIDFNQNIYGTDIEIEFLEYLRGEIKFGSVDKLKEQIQKDVDYAMKAIEKTNQTLKK